MITDWFVLLTPLVALMLVLVFVFVGCAQLAGLEEPVESPVPPGPPPGAYLVFDTALRPEYDPPPDHAHHVDNRPIHGITVRWTFHSKQAGASLSAVVQSKGSMSAPVAPPFDPFHLDVDGLTGVFQIHAIACQCEIAFIQGQDTAAHDPIPYTPGKTYLFRLKRGRISHPLPSVTHSEPPFLVLLETEKN